MTTEEINRPDPGAADVDEQAVEEFALRLVDVITGGLLTPLLEIGRRTGLFESALDGPATSAELADRAGLQERYVREWLGAMVSAGIFEYAATERRYWLPVEHAAVLTGSGVENLAPMAHLVTALTRHTDEVARCFASGGGVPYAAFLPEIREVMDGLWQPTVRDLLVQEILPMAPGLPDLLTRGARVADVACGSGNVAVTLGRAFPRSRFTGYDRDADGLEVARTRAAAHGLDNVEFVLADAAELSPGTSYDAVVVSYALHDQARPAQVLAAIREMLVPGGTLLMYEPRVSSDLADNVGNPFAPMTYAISVLHCLTVSLAEGGAGLGTAFGEQVALDLLADTGFGPVTVHESAADPGSAVFVTHRPA
ncbi:class I SAM-dependent methyltransferase [Nocardioides guangzhouensis]|uniref:Class I SAM-dependent methyltransferase n=1 Tax=Nocardioides guangzhouensis TaxID=2497878 RepID=A0A4V1XY66_9ACTN|nr:class I SAM-dependent methyltransferase [Nocardioides guangzhouensis]RYP82179.1 class I SAM-dependent methyltransferase [Nocardioides guangzhouensis]